MDNRGSWSSVASGLVQGWTARDDLEIVCVDLPGHGASSWLNGGAQGQRNGGFCWYSLEDYIGPLLSLVRDCLQWDSLSILGHSMGAAISLLLTLVLPATVVTSLVLVEGIGPNSSVPGVPLVLLGRVPNGERLTRGFCCCCCLQSLPHTLRIALNHNMALASSKRRKVPFKHLFRSNQFRVVKDLVQVYPSLESAIKARTEGNASFGLRYDAVSFEAYLMLSSMFISLF